jgi:hypothetical protein
MDFYPIHGYVHDRIRQPNSQIHSLYDSKPRHTDNNVQSPLLSSSVLESPHAIPVNIPESPGGRVHAPLAGIAERTARGNRLVNNALLHDRAVDRETVGRGLGGFGGCSGGNQSLEDGILQKKTVSVPPCCYARPQSCGGAYDDLGVPGADALMVIAFAVLQGIAAGLKARC